MKRLTRLCHTRGGATQAARKAALFPALVAAVAATFLALSCAAPIKIAASVDPLAVLEPGALAYARLSGEVARDLAPALLPASQLDSMKSLLARTRILALSLSSPLPPDSSPGKSFQAVLVGDYPFRAASLSFGSNPDWKRAKPAYYNAKLGLYAAVPGPNLLLASSRPIQPLLDAAKLPGPSPIPQRLAELASRELVLWAPEPFSGLGASLLGEALDLPVRGLLIAASPAAGERDRYEATVVFMTEDAKTLRAFKPVLRLAWYGMARILFGDDAEAALALPITTDGELFVVSGIPLSREALVRALGSLRIGPRS
jgi:hypothetical protein